MLAYRTLFAVALGVFAAGCASTGNPRRGEPTCRVETGMSEAQFLECACYRPSLDPERGVALVSTFETKYGSFKDYRCSLGGALGTTRGEEQVISVSVENGKVTRVGR